MFTYTHIGTLLNGTKQEYMFSGSTFPDAHENYDFETTFKEGLGTQSHFQIFLPCAPVYFSRKKILRFSRH